MRLKYLLFFVLLASTLMLTGLSCKATPKDGGVYKSADQAESWTQKVFIQKVKNKTYTISEYDINCFKFDPLDVNILYAGTKSNGLIITKDAGETWQPTGLAAGNISSFDIDPSNNLFMYATKDSTVLRSKDGGTTWETIHTDSQKGTFVKILVDTYDPTRLYVASTSGLLYKSIDQGNNWYIKFQSDEAISNFYLRHTDTRIIYILSAKGDVQKSVTGGEQNDWQTIFTKEHKEKWPKAAKAKNFFIIDSEPANMYMTALQGMLVSSDEGANWRVIDTLIPSESSDNEKIFDLKKDPNDPNIYYFYLKNSNKIYKSTDGGKEWHMIENYPTTKYINTFIINPNDTNIIYTGTLSPPKKKGLF